MPFPLAAVGAVAALVGATHDCDYCEDNVDDDEVQEKKETAMDPSIPATTATTGDVPPKKRSEQDILESPRGRGAGRRQSTERLSETSSPPPSQRGGRASSVRFHDDSAAGSGRRSPPSIGPDASEAGIRAGSVRSIESSNQQRTSSSNIILRALASSSSDDSSVMQPIFTPCGFVDGDFSSGKVHEIRVERSYVMAYQPQQRWQQQHYPQQRTEAKSGFDSSRSTDSTSSFANTQFSLLAVGLAKGLAFYETSSYSLVHCAGRRDMVSALKWCFPPNDKDALGRMTTTSKSSLLAVGSLDGSVCLYRIDVDVLESQGPTLLYESRVGGEVRALDCTYMRPQSRISRGGSSRNLFKHKQQQVDISRCGTPSTFVLAVGDKTGAITITSMFFSANLERVRVLYAQTVRSGTPNDGVLGLSFGRADNLGTDTLHRRSGGGAWPTIAGAAGKISDSGPLATSMQALAVADENSPRWLAVAYKSGRMTIREIQLSSGRDVEEQPLQQRHIQLPSQQQNQAADRRFLGRTVFSTQRSGPVRCVTFSEDSSILAMGGYDKKVVLVDTKLWAVSRELSLHGTINTIAFDPLGRYLGVGCRDKTFTLFDTSTNVAVKTFHTPGWVTSISFLSPDARSARERDYYDVVGRDTVALRSDRNSVSVLDLTPIHRTDTRLTSREGMESSISWSRDGRFVARAHAALFVVADAWDGFRDVISARLRGMVTKVSFCKTVGKDGLIAVVDDTGALTVFQLNLSRTRVSSLQQCRSVFVALNLTALAWSPDGNMLATGGRDGCLYFFNADDLNPVVEPVKVSGRVWDFDFIPDTVLYRPEEPLLFAVSLGDYTAVIFNHDFEPALQVMRSRTARCLRCHPTLPLMAIGDGAGTVAIVDYSDEEIVHEFDVGERVNVLDFSPVGDFLVVGTDGCHFTMYESQTYRCLQEMECNGFALSARFSPDGVFLAMGSVNDDYFLARLGPFVGIDLVPLDCDIGRLPTWATDEILYRSAEGPSFLQRHMARPGTETLRSVMAILRQYSGTVYAFNRATKEGCFDTAMVLKKPNLLKLAVTTLVDGTLDRVNDGRKSILTTGLPQQARHVIADIVKSYPADFAVDIFKAIAFTKVPFTEPRPVASGEQLECGSSTYTDPSQSNSHSIRRAFEAVPGPSNIDTREDVARTAAVLPVPGLGEMDLLSSLLANAPASVFDNEALGLVLRVMWKNHIRVYFYVDCALFGLFYASWIGLVELHATEVAEGDAWVKLSSWMGLLTLFFNTVFAAKEVVQSRWGRRDDYWHSIWNAFDLLLIPFVYGFVVIEVFIRDYRARDMVPLAVVTTLLLTGKLLSYLRGFAATGWLISVLTANIRDVRGFLIILFAILAGFSVSFRLLFATTGDESYGSLRRAFLTTFETTITGEYESSVLFEAEHTILATFTFVLAITCILVVALNALISILADSYARVQEDAIANKRREQAELVVEYMSLLPPRKRRQIERETRWFHSLLEVDADGDLLIHKDDWEGGLNALRRDVEELSEGNRESHQKALDQIKVEIAADLAAFKREVMSILKDVSDEVKTIRRTQSNGGITFSGKNVARAVRAVRTAGKKGTELLVGMNSSVS